MFRVEKGETMTRGQPSAEMPKVKVNGERTPEEIPSVSWRSQRAVRHQAKKRKLLPRRKGEELLTRKVGVQREILLASRALGGRERGGEADTTGKEPPSPIESRGLPHSKISLHVPQVK